MPALIEMPDDAPRMLPYRLGADLIIEDDTSRLGLRRRHAVRRDGMPDVEGLLRSIPKTAHHVAHWEWTDDQGKTHMMLVWKE